MKKIFVFALSICALLLALPSCNGNKVKEEENKNQELTDSLTTALAAQDSLMSLVTDINNGMVQINDMEGILSSSNLGSESASQKDQIKNNMQLISQALQSRREKLDALEAKLKKSGINNANFQKTIASMKEQLAQQEATITKLQEELKNAHIEIAGLNTKVNDLNTTVTNVTNEKTAAQAEATRVANELNTCYYVVGSNKELKANNIVQKKFLGKTKVMEGDFQVGYFTKADKRTLKELPLHSAKAKILTRHPAGSYQIVDNGGVKSLEITNPTKFWELSNFLIVQIN